MKIIALTRELNTMNTLFARKNIVEIRKFKKLMIFKIIFEKKQKDIEVKRLLSQERRNHNDFQTQEI